MARNITSRSADYSQWYLDVIKAALIKVFGKSTKLMYSILTDKENNLSQNVSSANTLSNGIKGTAEIGNKAPAATDAPLVQDLDSQLDPNYTFENFVEGNSNKLARTAGETIALNPASCAFNRDSTATYCAIVAASNPAPIVPPVPVGSPDGIAATFPSA